jgi:hypothetical protein
MYSYATVPNMISNIYFAWIMKLTFAQQIMMPSVMHHQQLNMLLNHSGPSTCAEAPCQYSAHVRRALKFVLFTVTKKAPLPTLEEAAYITDSF